MEHQSNFTFNDLVAARCGKGRFKMTPKDIPHLMMQEVNGGDFFKKLFMFLLENALIETPADGHCKPKILNFVDDVDDIKNLNWCGYVLSVLEATFPTWANRQSVNFSGPIYFLVGAYVDRVIYCRRRVIRSWPTINGWTTEALKQRAEVEHGQYDLIFFPIWGAALKYVICFDLPDGKMNIIEHSLAEPHASFEAKYGKTPSLLKKFFADALTRCKVPKMASQVRQCRTNLVAMPWRNNNVIDEGGIYVMRHMETYFGEREKDWECGLSASGTKSVEMFRIKYARTLLTCMYNTRGGENQKKATRLWKEKPKKFSFENWVALYGLD
ncbi:uncharacterized protein LOC121784058 [Salvia splendens]|uniref:uncharacterized protein LOC121784058 n=1 Tax=Salvia splendens TaxID=180675 RepID=UPI001C25A2BB|nr:uncharacterized protein LOC121784058 [Salvia splendens]